MLLIDAYNVLMVEGALPPHLAGLDLTGLAALLAISRYSRRQAILVCDGLPRDGPPAGAVGVRATLRYSGTDRTADDAIIEIVHTHSAPRTITLVTSDRALRAAVRRRRVETIPSERFLMHLARDEEAGGRTRGPARNLTLDRGTVAQWMREFGYDPSGTGRRPVDNHHPPPATPAKARAGSGEPSEVQSPVDPLLLAAVQAWAGRLHLSDLDMERWLRGPVPSRPPRNHPLRPMD